MRAVAPRTIATYRRNSVSLKMTRAPFRQAAT